MRDAFELAVQHHQAGQLDQAERLYKQVLVRQPLHADAVHNLGVIALQSGRNDLAVVLLRRAIALAPAQARGYSNLGNALLGLGQVDVAIEVFRQALALDPEHRDALSNLGVALLDKGAIDESVSIYRKLISKDSRNVEAHYNLGLALLARNDTSQATECFRRAIALRPEYAAAHHNLGTLLGSAGQIEEAITEFHRALAANPRFGQAYFHLGNTLMRVNRPVEAATVYRRLIALEPGHFEAQHHLGEALMKQGLLDEAISRFRESIALNPVYCDGFVGLSQALKDAGLLEEATVHLRRAISLRPESAHIHSDLILLLQYRSGLEPSEVRKEITDWNLRHARAIRPLIRRKPNDRAAGRRLRIGYVSADLRDHAVGRFMIPVIARHDRQQFEIHCFSNATTPDEVTGWFKSNVDSWHEIHSMNDAEAAELIGTAGIDILVDLSLHTGSHRLLVFARKPAPVQLTHLAYCGTSGLESMDYALADQYLCPPGFERHFVERVAHLPGSYWCFRPLGSSPDVSALPALGNGYITFGSLNNFCKTNELVFGAWSSLMRDVPNSRLSLHALEGAHRQRVIDQFVAAGIDSSRVQFAAKAPVNDYLRQYQSIDICLDPFPFCGGTTTCDALWMGVPVVSLAGKTPVARGGLSILSNVGLPELVAESTEEYIRIAVELAGDLPRLAQLRATMRQRMLASPLMDERQYVLDLEAIYQVLSAGGTPP